MRGSRRIHHKPYYPPTLKEKALLPYICRLAPGETGFALEWLDNACTGSHTLFYGLRGEEAKTALPLTGATAEVTGLLPDTDYEFYIEAETGAKSNLRLVRTGAIPEGAVVINYLHPEDTQYDFSGQYLCSPSLARTKSGRLVAGMDVFAGKAAQNLTLLFKSEDNGKTWRYLTDLFPFYWASLFTKDDVLYIFGLTTEYGSLQIACSHDEGETWSEPSILFHGSNVLCPYGGFHRAPMQVTHHKGRLYTSCEYGSWGHGSHLPSVLSIDEHDDPMVPENWSLADFLPFEGAWKEAAGCKQFDTIEGNVVPGPDGNLYNYMRWTLGSFLRLKVNEADPESPLEFAGIVPAPVSNSMFKVIYTGEKYLLLTNRKTEASGKFDCWTQRSVLSLFESEDMEHFTLLTDVVNRENEDPHEVGFQYPAYLYENGELLVVVRSGFNRAHNNHDANYSLFFHL